MVEADKLFINGKFYTLREEGETVSAVAVQDEKIVFVGTKQTADELSAAGQLKAKTVIDLAGKTVIPAFEDTHMHLSHTMDRFKQIDLKSAASLKEIQDKLAGKAASLKEGEWLLGYCIHIEKLAEGRFPNRHDLDAVSATIPIYVTSYCGHAAMANSRALELAGIGKGFVPPAGAFVDVDEAGEPTGILREHIQEYMNQFIGPMYLTESDAYEGLMAVLNAYAAYGVTTVQSNEGGKTGEQTVRHLMQMKENGTLPVRVIVDFNHFAPNPLGITSGFGDNMLKCGSHKFFIDGSMNSHTAALCEPYSCEPKTCGQLIYENDEDFIDAVKKTYEYGNTVAAHTIGDYAMDLMLRAIENCYDKNSPRRFRIIHAMLVNEEQLERLKKLPVVLDTQPNFLLNWVNTCEKNIGEKRAKLFLPYRTYLDCGLCVTGGSDSPVEVFNPFIGIQCAVTRQDLSHNPPSGFEPQERISVYEAVCLYTKNAAYSNQEESLKGTIAVGKLADFAVLNEDIFETAPEHIAEITVAKTILGGRVVYEA